MALKTIMNIGREKSTGIFDENTTNIIEQMNKISNEIILSIKSLETLSYGSYGDSADSEKLRLHLLEILDKQLIPIVEHFT